VGVSELTAIAAIVTAVFSFMYAMVELWRTRAALEVASKDAGEAYARGYEQGQRDASGQTPTPETPVHSETVA